MSLSAKERILKLRETEFKLNKLQNDLTKAEKKGGSATSAFMSRFLEHHKELMSLPGRTRNSISHRLNVEVPKRYMEAQPPPSLTLPPTMDILSTNRLKYFKEPEFETGHRHPSLALQSLINELEDQTEKMAIAFPKFDRIALLKKAPGMRGIQPLNSNRYVGQTQSLKKNKSSKTINAYRAHNRRNLKADKEKSTAILYAKPVLRKTSKTKPSRSSSKTKLAVKWEEIENAISLSASKSDISMEFFKANLPLQLLPNSKSNDDSDKRIPSTKQEDEGAQEDSLAYAIESSNLMGVILPPKAKRGPTTWFHKGYQPRTLPVTKKLSEDEVMSAKDALQLLRRRDRELPERNSFARESLHPHQRGLVGVEISGFDPQCTFFYRDRNGNYNPHLQTSYSGTGGKPANNRLTRSLTQHS